jgi:hypothetical protein
LTAYQASGGDNEGNVTKLKDILSKLPIGGGDDKVNQGEEMHAQAKAYHFDPDNVAPPEVQQQLLDLLKWRDQVYRDVVAKIEMVPGLSDLLDELTNALNACKFSAFFVIPVDQTLLLRRLHGHLSLHCGMCPVHSSALKLSIFL